MDFCSKENGVIGYEMAKLFGREFGRKASLGRMGAFFVIGPLQYLC